MIDKIKHIVDSVCSYAVSLFLTFYGFTVENGTDIAIFLGVMIGLVRLVTDLINLKRTVFRE